MRFGGTYACEPPPAKSPLVRAFSLKRWGYLVRLVQRRTSQQRLGLCEECRSQSERKPKGHKTLLAMRVSLLVRQIQPERR